MTTVEKIYQEAIALQMQQRRSKTLGWISRPSTPSRLKLLPEALYRVIIKGCVHTHNWNLLSYCLRDDEPIEWITVVEGQCGQYRCMPRLDRQYNEPILPDPPINKGFIRLGQMVLVDADLYCDLPVNGRADQLLVAKIFNQAAR
jgi:hypothetical protein